MKEGPLSTLITSYYVKPVNYEANPYQNPFYKGGNQFQKGGPRKYQKESGEEVPYKKENNEGFQRNQFKKGGDGPRQEKAKTLEFEASHRPIQTQPDQESDEEFEVVQQKDKKEKGKVFQSHKHHHKQKQEEHHSKP